MVKRMTIFRIKPGTSEAEIEAWWKEHRDMVKQQPKLRGYVTSLLQEAYGDSGYRGMAELWYDTMEDLSRANDLIRPNRAASRKHSELIVTSRNIFVAQETVVVPPSYRVWAAPG